MNLNTISGPCKKATRDCVEGICLVPSYAINDSPTWKLGPCVSYEQIPSAAEDIANADEVKVLPEFKQLMLPLTLKASYVLEDSYQAV